jgi:hypothetical protein
VSAMPLPDGVRVGDGRGREHHRHHPRGRVHLTPPQAPRRPWPRRQLGRPRSNGRRRRSSGVRRRITCVLAGSVVVGITAGSPARTQRARGRLFVPTQPARLLDTRQPSGPEWPGPRLWTGGGREVDVSAVTGGGAAAVVANLTVVGSDGPGWLARRGPTVRHGVVDQRRRRPGDARQPAIRAGVHPGLGLQA